MFCEIRQCLEPPHNTADSIRELLIDNSENSRLAHHSLQCRQPCSPACCLCCVQIYRVISRPAAAAREPRRSVDILSQLEEEEAEEGCDWLQAGVG